MSGPWLRRLKPFAGYAACLIVLALWSRLPGTWVGTAFLPVWLGTSLLIFTGTFEAARLKRQAWLGQYLRETSSWRRWLAGGWLMRLVHLLVGLVLSLLFVIKLRLMPNELLWVLLGAVILMVLLRERMQRVLVPHIIDGYTPAITRRLLVLPMVLIMTLVLVGVLLFVPQPMLVEQAWADALNQHLQGRQTVGLPGVLERGYSALQLTQYWLLQNTFEQLHLARAPRVLGWSLLFITHGAFAWAFVRVFIGLDVVLRQGRATEQAHAQRSDKRAYES